MRREHHIRRYEHNYRGWVVAIKRRGRHWVKYFSDKPWGRAAALRRAREHRDQMLAQLPRVTKVKRTYILNTTGVVGVARVKEHTRAGTPFVRYVATWPTTAGSSMKASFSVGLYGEAKARQLAIRARRQGLEGLLHGPAGIPLPETAHLLRSPANARRLLSALRRALGRKGRPQTPTSLRRAQAWRVSPGGAATGCRVTWRNSDTADRGRTGLTPSPVPR